MALEQLKIREIVKQSVSKNVDIPEFQREFVWDPEQVKLLAESLYRDYPVGSFLLWDSSEYQEAKTAQGTQASMWIVDGQQRTTALCLLIGQKPYWWNDAQDWNKALERHDPMVNLLPENGDERLEFALPNPIRRRDPRWVNVRKVLRVEKVEELTSLAQEIAGQATITSDQMALFGAVHARLQRLWQVRERDIPVVKINHEVEDVAEIFARLNRAGTRVKEADVVLALAAVRNPGWVREQYLPFRNELEDRGWDLDAGILIRTMTGIGHGRARLIEVPKDFWSPEKLPAAWKKTQYAIAEVLKRLSEFGITSNDLLPSSNSLIPLCTLQFRWSNDASFQFTKALHWFLLANRDGRYSGSAITSLNEDVRTICDATGFGSALDSLHKRLRVSNKTDAEDFLRRYDRWGGGKGFPRLVLYLCLYRNGAVDWVDSTKLGYDRSGVPVATGFEPQWHHIYPRSVLKKKGLGDDDIHALANITVLNERTNVLKLSSKEPWKYIQQFNVSEQQLTEHLIPGTFIRAVGNGGDVVSWQWDVERYPDFLNQRAQLLASSANAYLDTLA